MSSISPLDEDESGERINLFAEMVAQGARRKDMAEAFQVTPGTITQWRKRSDVQQKVTQLIRERSNAILSHTDHAIQKRLEESALPNGKAISTETLLKIRTVFAADAPASGSNDSATSMEELMKLLHDDPDLAKRFGVATTDGDDT